VIGALVENTQPYNWSVAAVASNPPLNPVNAITSALAVPPARVRTAAATAKAHKLFLIRISLEISQRKVY
jgi:hypothetical protein